MPETVKSERTIKGITSEAQYRRHIWADIRPYVCPVRGCDADANQLISRTDFGAHLKEHHSTNSLGNKSTEHISTLRCPFCKELLGEVAIIGHICHHLEVESCYVFSQETGEEVEKNGLNMTLSNHDTVQEPFQLNPDQKYSQPHETRRSDGDTREALLNHDGTVDTDSLFTNTWIDTQPITHYTELNDNNDRLIPKASTEITNSLVDSFASRDMKGDEASYASNQPASAGFALTGQDQTHQNHSQLTTIDDISPKSYPSKCPHSNCASHPSNNKIFTGSGEWMAHYYRAHKKRYSCATCDAIFGTRAEFRYHSRFTQDDGVEQSICMIPGCSGGSKLDNRKHTLKEHMEI